MGMISNMITGLINKNDFSYDEMKGAFLRILRNEETEMEQGAFIAALSAKGATAEEIKAVTDAILEVDTCDGYVNTPIPAVDNCGTGMDKIKTFNISTTSSLVAASFGCFVARHGSRSITSGCGTVDVAECLGIDVDCPSVIITNSIEKAGVGLFNGGSSYVHPTALGRILSKMNFGSFLNVAASLANPSRVRHGVRGVYSSEILVSTAEIMAQMGYERAIIVCGLDEYGNDVMDEASTIGKTRYVEIIHGEVGEIKEFSYADFGLNYANLDEIRTYRNPVREAQRIERILEGYGSVSENEIIALNSALILYVSGIADSIEEGVKMVLDKLTSGQCYTALEDWRKYQGKSLKLREA